MAKEGLSATITVTGLKETMAALKKMPDDAKAGLKDTSFELAQSFAREVRAAARASSAQSGLMAGTTTVGKNNGADSDLPIVSMGGSSKVGRRGAAAFKILFGAEFGAHVLPQFRPFNATGYFFFPTVDAMSDEIGEKWSAAADKVIAEFSAE